MWYSGFEQILYNFMTPTKISSVATSEKVVDFFFNAQLGARYVEEVRNSLSRASDTIIARRQKNNPSLAVWETVTTIVAEFNPILAVAPGKLFIQLLAEYNLLCVNKTKNALYDIHHTTHFTFLFEADDLTQYYIIPGVYEPHIIALKPHEKEMHIVSFADGGYVAVGSKKVLLQLKVLSALKDAFEHAFRALSYRSMQRAMELRKLELN